LVQPDLSGSHVTAVTDADDNDNDDDNAGRHSTNTMAIYDISSTIRVA